MPLDFVGIDPNTGSGQSPTIWVDQEDPAEVDLVFQGWKADEETEAECAQTVIPGHAVGIPANEAVIRIPARMVPLLRKACDIAERAQLRGAVPPHGADGRPSGDA
jgi:hypothetical protein